MANDNVRCEGWSRYGVFTLGGSTTWRQCKSDAIVSVESVQDGVKSTMPACKECWEEGIKFDIQITKVTPI